jgi:enoyl-CoA hydratase/carnithine racemase
VSAGGYRDILFAVADGIALVTLNRPEQMNAFTGAMGEDLERAYRACDEDDAVRAVVLTGAGRAFCAGADLAGGAETFARPGEGFSAAAVGLPAWEVRKPVIAALNGHAIGLGLTPAQVERRETELHRHLMGMADAVEGPVAWLERRRPEWKGRVGGDWPRWPDEGESG